MKSLLGKGIAFALAGTMVLATASCGGSGDSKTQTADSSTGSLEKVEMYTIPDPQMSAAHVIAMEKGYYEECLAKGMTEPYGHAVSRPPVVEVEATERTISLAKLAKAPLYVAHVTAKGAMEAIRDAYADGYPIFGETCTHYLTLTTDNLAKPNFEGAKYVCSPALRSQEHLDALWGAVKKGYLNAISSDHCGFNWKDNKHQGKDNFVNIPNGAPGMGDRMNVIWTYGVETGKISRQKYVELCCTNPAKINEIYPQKGVIAPGSDADIVIFDPKYEGVFTNADSLQGVDYSTYEGMKQKGRPDKVFPRGELVADCGKYVGKSGTGQFVSAKPFGLCYE